MALEVYVLIRSVDYEGYDIVDIYTSEIRANEQASYRNLTKESYQTDVSFHVENWIVIDA